MSSQESISSTEETRHDSDKNKVQVVALTKENLEHHKQETDKDSGYQKLKRYYDCIQRWKDANVKDDCERLVKRVRIS